MKISDVIQAKGSAVVTIPPSAPVSELVRLLSENNIGAAVVSSDGRHVEGIISERDIVRGLGHSGAAVLDGTVADLMTADVHAIAPEDALEDAAATMTVRRVRHMPVIVDGAMVGLVSIGDVVKHRIEQLTDERNHLLGYLHN